MQLRKITIFLISVAISLTALAQSQSGKASYYSKRMTGTKTANGERLHHDSMTCAHKSFKFGTFLKVTNIETGKTVVVRVNDRGPYIRGRIVDLSYGAAARLGILGDGTAHVRIEKAEPENTIWFDVNRFDSKGQSHHSPLGPLHLPKAKIDSTLIGRPMPVVR